jgi:hypothetical protein
MIQIGDVFTLPVADGRVAVGQVVGAYQAAFFVAVFTPTFAPDEIPSAADAVSEPVALLALTFDARFHSAKWRVVGNTAPPDDIPMPAYQEATGTPATIHAVDWSGRRRRPAREGELTTLPHRQFVAPIRVEKANQARLGLGPWRAEYDDLLPTRPTTKEIFG